MRKQLFLSAIILLTVSTCYGQFPAFTNFEGVKYYVNNRNDSAIKKYREVYGLNDKIDSYYADSLRTRAKNSIKLFEDSIPKTIADNALTPAIKNSRIIGLRDSISFYEDVRDYYASINKFTGTPRFRAMFLPVSHSYQARFFYQNSPEVDSTAKNINFLSSFAIQTSINKTAIASDLISGALWIFKATISTTVVDNNDTTNKDKVNNKINFGGLLNGQVTLPLFYYAGKRFAMYCPFTFTSSVDNVSVNRDTLTKNTFYFSELATSVYMRIPFINTNYDKNNASLFINAKIGYIDGGSNFYDKLESTRSGFWLARATAGIEVSSKLRLAVNFPIYSSQKDIFNKQTTTIGIQIDPKLLASK